MIKRGFALNPELASKAGKKGGKLGRNGGFACEFRGPDGLTGRQRAAIAGSKGGRISRRKKLDK